MSAEVTRGRVSSPPDASRLPSPSLLPSPDCQARWGALESAEMRDKGMPPILPLLPRSSCCPSGRAGPADPPCQPQPQTSCLKIALQNRPAGLGEGLGASRRSREQRPGIPLAAQMGVHGPWNCGIYGKPGNSAAPRAGSCRCLPTGLAPGPRGAMVPIPGERQEGDTQEVGSGRRDQGSGRWGWVWQVWGKHRRM